MQDFSVHVSSSGNSNSFINTYFASKKIIRTLTTIVMAAFIFSALSASIVLATEFDIVATKQTKQDKIKELIRTSGMEKTIDQMIPKTVTQQFALVGKLRQDIPKSLLSDLADQTTLEMMASKKLFLDALVPVYDRHMTESEVSALIKIYRDPELISILKKIPALNHDSREVARYWGKAVSDKVFRHMSDKLMNKGFKI